MANQADVSPSAQACPQPRQDDGPGDGNISLTGEHPGMRSQTVACSILPDVDRDGEDQLGQLVHYP